MTRPVRRSTPRSALRQGTPRSGRGPRLKRPCFQFACCCHGPNSPTANSHVVTTAKAGLLTILTLLPLFRPPYGKSDGIATAQGPGAPPGAPRCTVHGTAYPVSDERGAGRRGKKRRIWQNASERVVTTSILPVGPQKSGKDVENDGGAPPRVVAPSALVASPLERQPRSRPTIITKPQQKTERPGQCPGLEIWWSMRDLNPRPCACKAPALPLRQSTECERIKLGQILCHSWAKNARAAVHFVPFCRRDPSSQSARRTPYPVASTFPTRASSPSFPSWEYNRADKH